MQNVNISESKRDQWNNDLEYFMSVLGYAVGNLTKPKDRSIFIYLITFYMIYL